MDAEPADGVDVLSIADKASLPFLSRLLAL